MLGARTPDQLSEQLGAIAVELSDDERRQVDATISPGRATVPYYLDDSVADFRPHAHRW